MNTQISNGEVIDSMTIEDIINNDDFFQLNVFNGEHVSPDYWEITFESKQPTKQHTYLTIFNKEVPTKFYKFYKLK